MMLELNRIAIVIKPTQLMLDWIMSLDKEEYKEISLDSLRKDSSVALLPAAETIKEFNENLEASYIDIFTSQLELWSDEDLWPADLSFELFQSWFNIERYQTVFDFGWTNDIDEIDDEVESIEDCDDDFYDIDRKTSKN